MNTKTIHTNGRGESHQDCQVSETKVRADTSTVEFSMLSACFLSRARNCRAVGFFRAIWRCPSVSITANLPETFIAKEADSRFVKAAEGTYACSARRHFSEGGWDSTPKGKRAI